jgi:3-oxoacyl-[acyl-carrier protein] reductase
MPPNEVVVIMASAGSLGSSLAEHIAGDGSTALVLCDLNSDSLAELDAKLHSAQAEVVTSVVDVGDAEAVDGAIREAADRFGRVDVLVNNAGILTSNGRIHNQTLQEWERCIRVNLMGAVHGIRSVVPHMRSARKGSIINTASAAGFTAWAYAAPYGVTKAAIIHLTKIAAVEYAGDGIRVNCVCPGVFRSAIHEGLPEEAMDAMASRHPMGLGQADDMVGAYAYLAGESSRWVTGTSILVDGGYCAP